MKSFSNEACENEKVECDYGFLRNEDNFLLGADYLESKSESKWKYVDPRIKPCLVLVERCNIPQTLSNCRSNGSEETENKYKCNITAPGYYLI